MDFFFLDRNSLIQYLYKTSLPQFIAPLEIKKFSTGQSNPTYLLTEGRLQKYVLRKKPNGELLSPSAHAIEREFQLLNAIAQSNTNNLPIPKVFCLCSDSSIIGTPFYIMEYIEGRIFPVPTLHEIPFDDRKLYWYAAIDALAQLHKVNTTTLKIHQTSTNNYYKRQLKTLLHISNVQAQVRNAQGHMVGYMPGRDELVRWFEMNVPENNEVCIVHGDYKFDNLIFHQTKPKVIGILDWELSTIGHPLSDLASLLLCHYVPSHISGLSIEGIQGSELGLGLPTLDQCIERYVQAMNRPKIDSFEYYIAFILFKYAVIAQGVRARMYRDQASSHNAENASQLFEICAELAMKIILQTNHHWQHKL